MVRKAALIALLLVATPALGQQTNCRWIGGTWSCDTSPRRTALDPNLYQRSYDQSYRRTTEGFNETMRILAERQRAEQEAANERRREEAAASEAQAQAELARARDDQAAGLRKSVGEMLSTGNCAGAQDLALGAGDIELATQVKTYCASPPRVPSPKP
jgi:hypothetical protein